MVAAIIQWDSSAYHVIIFLRVPATIIHIGYEPNCINIAWETNKISGYCAKTESIYCTQKKNRIRKYLLRKVKVNTI